MEAMFSDLKANEIDCRVSQINEKGLTLLLYKDARVDMDILDETVGAKNWQRTHTRDNANCIIEIWDEDKKQWICKEDTGTESFTEKEKGLASDSFKRAGFNWGIGRELYTAPAIFIIPRKDMVKRGKESEFFKNDKGKYTTKTRFFVEYIDYDKNDIIKDLIIRDDKQHIRFTKLTKEKEQEFAKLQAQLKELIIKVEENIENFDREKLYKNYGVESDGEMLFSQMEEAIEILKKKLEI